MFCSQCGKPGQLVLLGCCQACVNRAASKTTAPSSMISPTPNSQPTSAHQLIQSKRQEAIQRARGLYSHPTSTPVIPSPLSQPPAPTLLPQQTHFPPPSASNPGLPAITAPEISRSNPYLMARTARMSAIQPYPTQRAARTAARVPKPPKLPTSKGALPLTSPPDKISVQCGFEMWYRSKWTQQHGVLRTNHFVNWADPSSFTSLLTTLCNKFCDLVELKTKITDERAMFAKEHFHFCRLGSRKGGSVEDYDSFVDFLKREKVIDLIYDQDAFEKFSLDEEERLGMEAESARHKLRSSQSRPSTNRSPTPESEMSYSSLPSPKTVVTRSTSIVTRSASAVSSQMFTMDDSTKQLSQNIPGPLTQNKVIPTAINLSPPDIPLPNPPCSMAKEMKEEDGIVVIRVTPPWRAEAILNPNDLSWDRFGTLETSYWDRGSDDSDWVDGVRYHLEVDGLIMVQRICLYRVDYKKCFKLKPGSKVIAAEILNSGTIFQMVAEYELQKKDLSKESYSIWPNCVMRSYAAARQFLAQFAHAVKSSDDCSTSQRQLAAKLRIVDNFPVHHDFMNRGRSGDPYVEGQDDDMLPAREDTPESYYVDGPHDPEEEPSRVFIMEEHIEGYSTLLSAATKDYYISNHSKTIDLLLHSFQHWVYAHTKGQMTITNFKGNPPLIAKPQIVDLNKKYGNF
ncbi:hypothetical protein PGT21_029522 [Puccinia graminis f. sp. tritici]|uniref:Alpha-type protein kinase domain-containing protein n=1 Tax=Puccinia graminis f. sp. tritici TaxID=56615 RepID=A0A5B0NHM7_PUCGR|nr:hypothetical protein PGT21_029522 [Puccinia graminis f. sp. tritici]